MFCKNCGQKNEENNKFCISCGLNLNEETKNNVMKTDNNKAKIISIIGVVLCFIPILNIIGLILSIIALIMNRNYKKTTGKSTNYFVLNIIGLIISIIEIMIIIVIIICIIVSYDIYKDSYVGKWNCSSYSSIYNYSVEAEFKENGTFSWGKYGDVSNNNFIGTYKVNGYSNNYKFDQNNDYDKKYDIKLKINSYTLNGKYQDDLSGLYENLDTNMYIDDDNSIITINTTNKKYYCKRVNNYFDD